MASGSQNTLYPADLSRKKPNSFGTRNPFTALTSITSHSE